MCSYCGCRESAAIIARYSTEHDEIVNALGDVRRTVAAMDLEGIAASAGALESLLDPHTASEERALFAELRKNAEFTEAIDGLCAEHTLIADWLTRVKAREAGAIETLEQILHRHIDKEENGIFPAAIMALDADAWDRANSAA